MRDADFLKTLPPHPYKIAGSSVLRTRTCYTGPMTTPECQHNDDLSLKRLPAPIHLPVRDWAVVRLSGLQDPQVVLSADTEDQARVSAKRRTAYTGVYHIACRTTVDRSRMPYRMTVEILV